MVAPRAGEPDRPLWIPDAERVRRANLTAFLGHVRRRQPAGSEAVTDYPSLYQWSVAHPEAFWPEVWAFCGVVADERPEEAPWERAVVGLDRMAPPERDLGPGGSWAPGSTSPRTSSATPTTGRRSFSGTSSAPSGH